MENPLPLQAFVVGLVSALHCWGMCGAIIGAMSLSLPRAVRDNGRLLLLYTLTYNTGRVLSYALAGFLVTLLGQTLFFAASPAWGHLVLQLLGAVALVATGFYLGGWFPRFAFLEKLGAPLWRGLEPLWRRLFPVSSVGRALLLGVVWGWMPCGLVYTALAVSLAAASPGEGALTMAAFGLGTLPGTMAAGWVVERLTRWQRQVWVQRAVAGLFVVMGLATMILAAVGDHAGHAVGFAVPVHGAMEHDHAGHAGEGR